MGAERGGDHGAVVGGLGDGADGLRDTVGGQVGDAQYGQRAPPSRWSRPSRAPCPAPGGVRRRRTATAVWISGSVAAGTARRTISTARAGSGKSIQWYRQRRRSASCSSRLRFEVSTTTGGVRAVKVPSSGIVMPASPRNSNSSASNSSSARSISSISSTGGTGPRWRTACRIGRSWRNSAVNRSASVSRVVMRLGQPDRQQLPLVVPFVERLAGGEPLVALQPDQRCLQRAGQRLRGGGLADPRLALQQQGPAEAQGQEQGRRHAVVDQVVDGVEAVPDGLGVLHASPASRRS